MLHANICHVSEVDWSRAAHDLGQVSDANTLRSAYEDLRARSPACVYVCVCVSAVRIAPVSTCAQRSVLNRPKKEKQEKNELHKRDSNRSGAARGELG